jgi:hypothetical protein
MNETSKVGRPMLPNKEKRGRFISTRLSPPEYVEIEAAIRFSGESKTEWVRKKLIAAARMVIPMLSEPIAVGAVVSRQVGIHAGRTQGPGGGLLR